mgnify:CR=1 FL=1
MPKTPQSNIPHGVFKDECDCFLYRGLQFNLTTNEVCPNCGETMTQLALFEQLDLARYVTVQVHCCTCYECDNNWFYQTEENWK